MDRTNCRLTVYFEDPFWIGVFERSDGREVSAVKVIFGKEPKDYEVLEYLLHDYDQLAFSPPIAQADRPKARINPKRMSRQVHRQMERTGIGTKSQQALKLQQEQNKLQRKCRSREQREAEKERLFALKQQKRKEKHRGR